VRPEAGVADPSENSQRTGKLGSIS